MIGDMKEFAAMIERSVGAAHAIAQEMCARLDGMAADDVPRYTQAELRDAYTRGLRDAKSIDSENAVSSREAAEELVDSYGSAIRTHAHGDKADARLTFDLDMRRNELIAALLTAERSTADAQRTGAVAIFAKWAGQNAAGAARDMVDNLISAVRIDTTASPGVSINVTEPRVGGLRNQIIDALTRALSATEAAPTPNPKPGSALLAAADDAAKLEYPTTPRPRDIHTPAGIQSPMPDAVRREDYTVAVRANQPFMAMVDEALPGMPDPFRFYAGTRYKHVVGDDPCGPSIDFIARVRPDGSAYWQRLHTADVPTSTPAQEPKA